MSTNLLQKIANATKAKSTSAFEMPVEQLCFKQVGASTLETPTKPSSIGQRIPFMTTKVIFRTTEGAVSVFGANPGSEFDSANIQVYGKYILPDPEGNPLVNEDGQYVLNEDTGEKAMFSVNATFVTGAQGSLRFRLAVPNTNMDNFCPRVASMFMNPTTQRQQTSQNIDDSPAGLNGLRDQIEALIQLLDAEGEHGITITEDSSPEEIQLIENLRVWKTKVPLSQSAIQSGAQMANVQAAPSGFARKPEAEKEAEGTVKTAEEVLAKLKKKVAK